MDNILNFKFLLQRREQFYRVVKQSSLVKLLAAQLLKLSGMQGVIVAHCKALLSIEFMIMGHW